MTISKIEATGFTGTFEDSVNGYTFQGSYSCDGNKAIKSFTADVINGSGESAKKVCSFTVYLNPTESNIQSAIMSAISTVRANLDSALDTAQA